MAAKPTPASWLAPLPAGAPIAIFGAARSGKAAAALARAAGWECVIYDERAEGCAPFTREAADTHRLVVFSPGFPSDHPWLRIAAQAGSTLLPEIEFGYGFWKGPVWAVTGTNGKSTLADLLAAALRLSGRPAVATGNIGHPLSAAALECADPATFAVCEVSSFQAEMLVHFRSSATLWTNLAEDHLERHGSMSAYFLAKHRLAERTEGGRLWHGPSVREHAAAAGIDPDRLGICVDTSATAPAGVEGTLFSRPPQLENIHLAVALWRGLGLPEQALMEAARNRPAVPHRLAFCGSVGGISCHNDSKGTNFHAVLGALSTFDTPPHWIGGGKDKGGSLNGFAEALAPAIASATLIGETGPALAAALRQHCAQHIPVSTAPDLESALDVSLSLARPGEHILFSPGFASFDQFRNYADRGQRFEQAVHLRSGRPALAPTK